MGSAQSGSSQSAEREDDVWWSNSQKPDAAAPPADHAETLQTLVKQVAELKDQLTAERSGRRTPGSSDGIDPGGGADILEPVMQHRRQRQEELDLLKKDISLKREARQKKISAVSAEMDRLRSEVTSERTQRIRLEAMLNCGESIPEETGSLAEELCRLRDDLAREKTIREAIASEKTELTKHNQELVAALEKTSTELRRERANNESLVIDNEKMSSVISEGEVCIEKMKEELHKSQAELRELRQQVLALKDVAAISGQMLKVREVQVKDMKHKLSEIEAKISKDNVETTVNSLRQEYETQIKNIRDLKQLYEDRARVLESEKQKVEAALSEKSTQIDALNNSIAEFEEKAQKSEEKAQKVEEELKVQADKNIDLEFQLGDTAAECRSLNSQMSRINDLFTQMLLGAVTTNGMDLDKMSRLLHENHDLIADITSRGGCTDDAPALPKLILDLLNQIEREAANETSEDVSESSADDPSDIIVDVVTVDDDTTVDVDGASSPEPTGEAPPASSAPAEEAAVESSPVPATGGQVSVVSSAPAEEATVESSASLAELAEDHFATDSKEDLIKQISSNLPKVWKVLLELVSQQGDGRRRRRTSLRGDDACYKAVDTPRGPQLVISVSKTYLRLKDLILEKRHLERELSRLKSLNGHLEARLDEQEQRLSLVQSELHKTWGVVGRMKAQHQQLHTHEKILRYELHQKRELLNELKQELEYCREKWESARQKNTETAREWRQLRKEFAARRARDSAANNSGESGLGEEETSCEDDADGDAEESSGRSESPMATVHEEPQVSLSLAEDIPALEADELVPSELSHSAASSSVVQPLEPAQVAIVQETEAQHAAVELETEETHVAVVSETEPAQVAVVLQTEAAHAAAVLESQPTQVAAVVMEVPPAQRAVVSQSPPGVTGDGSSGALDAEVDDSADGLQALKARALVQFAKRSAEYLQEQAVQPETRVAPVALPRRTRMQPVRTATAVWRPSAEALQNVSNPQSVFDLNVIPVPDSAPAPSFFFGTRAADRQIDFESDVTPQMERATDTATTTTTTTTTETVLDARAARLQRLEQQAQLLANRVSNTTHRSEMLSSRLEELHEQYGPDRPRRANRLRPTQQTDERQRQRQNTEPETERNSDPPPPPPPLPPPMPDTLPAFRLPTESSISNRNASTDNLD